MGLFEPVTIQWKGTNYTVPADQVMRLIAAIEDVVTMVELNEALAKGAMPMAKISLAFHKVLVFAGANASCDEVYAAWFGVGGEDTRNSVVNSINSLLTMMIPPSIADAVAEEAETEEAGKTNPAPSS